MGFSVMILDKIQFSRQEKRPFGLVRLAERAILLPISPFNIIILKCIIEQHCIAWPSRTYLRL